MGVIGLEEMSVDSDMVCLWKPPCTIRDDVLINPLLRCPLHHEANIAVSAGSSVNENGG